MTNQATAPWRYEKAAIWVILLVALFLRLYQITTLPGGISGDELFNAIDAARVGREHWPLFFEGNNGREALFLYLMAASMQLLGQTIFAIRLPAVILGTLTVWLAWRIGRTQFNWRVGLLAAALIAVSLWPVMESRWALRAVSLTCGSALTLHLLDLGFRQQKWRYWLLGGLALGLTMYTYIPSRAFPAVVLVWFGWLFWARRKEALAQWPHMLTALLLALLIFAPFANYMRLYPEKVNQRIGGLNVALNVALETGNLRPLAESVGGVLQMFSLHGDIEWRYHVSGDPVFDPITSIFFYAGVLICLWLAFSRSMGNEKRPSYALLLLWTGAMLAPNAILEANPSFLRAAGAIVPIYLMTAIGFDTLMLLLHGRFPRIINRQFIGALVLVGLALTAAHTWYRYATIWNNQTDVRRIYQSDTAIAAQYLNQNAPPANTRIFFADSYVLDLIPQTFAFSSSYPVDWFDINTSFAQGPPNGDDSIWVFQTVNETLPPETAVWLQTTPHISTTHTFPNGDPAFTRYQFAPGALQRTPQHPLLVDYADGPQLLGYDLPAELYRGETIPIYLYWRIPSDQTDLPNRLDFVQVSLQDSQGTQWQKSSTLLGYPQASWRSEDRFMQLVLLEIPAGMPPGEATLRVDIHDSDGNLYPIVGATTPDSPLNQSDPLVIRSRPVADYQPPADVPIFADQVVLENATLSTNLTPGLDVNISLDWAALTPPAADYQVQFQLWAPDANEPLLSQTRAIWPGVYPLSQWQAGEQVSSAHTLAIPLDIPTDAPLELRINLLDANGAPLPLTQGSAKLADMTWVLREHSFTVPEITYPLEAQFGDDIRLLGYELKSANGRTGENLHLTLIWQAINTPAAHYTVFNHIPASDGTMQGQLDGPPSGDAWLTGTWLPGEIIRDERVIPLRDDAVNGRYPLLLGLYNSRDGVRLPVTVNSQPQPGDQLVLTEIEIGP
jgi:4-amino-4-deoxy-L-arabinose transferase-like glycosyltransferase